MNLNNRTDNTPLYYKIYNNLKNKIDSGELIEGSNLPSERDLSLNYNVSRATVRQALKKLEDEKFVYRVHGNGTFVSKKMIKQDLTTFYSFYEEIKKSGKIPSSKVLFHKIIEPNEKMIEIFKIPSSVKILYIQRLRLIDNEPTIYEDTYIPLNRFENFDVNLLNEFPMYSIFKDKYNVDFEKATESLSPILLEKKEILNYLDYDKKAVCMVIERLTYERNKVIEYTISYARGDKYEYTVTLNI